MFFIRFILNIIVLCISSYKLNIFYSREMMPMIVSL